MSTAQNDEIYFLLDYELRSTIRIDVINEGETFIQGLNPAVKTGQIIVRHNRNFVRTQDYLLICDVRIGSTSNELDRQYIITKEISALELIKLRAKNWTKDVEVRIDESSESLQLWINNKLCTKCEIQLDSGYLAAKIEDRIDASELEQLTNYNIFKIFSKIEYDFKLSLFDSCKIVLYGDYSDEFKPFISLELVNSGFTWNKPYSIQQYHTAMINLHPYERLKEYTSYLTEIEDHDSPLGFIKYDFQENASLQLTIDTMIALLKDFHEAATLELQPHDMSINFEFYFPDEIRAPCEQYLIYFSQFMVDLGINVSNEIHHKDEKTIFSVIPENKNKALSIIRDALVAYTSIPSEEKLTLTNISSDISVAQLEFNVTNLKSQIQLIKATMMAYENTIEAQKLALQTLQVKAPINETMQQREDNKCEDVESVFGNFIQVKKFDKNGVIINYPLLIRTLKRKFKSTKK